MKSKIEEIRALIAATEQRLRDREHQKEASQKKRASLALAGGDVAAVDEAIAECQREIDSVPHELALLGRQLANAEAEQEVLERAQKERQQASHASVMVSASRELVDLLTLACKVNVQLLQATEAVVALRDITGIDAPKNVCQGSRGMLDYVRSICEQEISGARGLRTVLPSPCPQV